VREHLGRLCPDALLTLDAAASKARATPLQAALVPAPPLDASHCHAPNASALAAAHQLPGDPELSTQCSTASPGHPASPWLAREFTATLDEVNGRIVRSGSVDPFVALRGLLPALDQLREGADPDQLRQSQILLGVELDRVAQREACALGTGSRGGRPGRFPLVSLDELFEAASVPRLACEQEIGGRSL
jgi:hypothetical protein